jgi:hypothetical protein
MIVRGVLPVDLRPVESRRTRSGWKLRCPRCACWAATPLIVGPGRLACHRCRNDRAKVGAA